MLTPKLETTLFACSKTVYCSLRDEIIYSLGPYLEADISHPVALSFNHVVDRYSDDATMLSNMEISDELIFKDYY
jgi:hypothetical protein